ncbi:MAG: phosphatase PAP2 family protein [Gloeocapsa sp. DLM2.Bin57]|nr:MAG: phosphatase PAP2 family protein [Gloeocapsa sp. DLM2.Bin57]
MNQINHKSNQLTIGVILALLSFIFLGFTVSNFSDKLAWDSAILLGIHSQSQPILDQLAIMTTDLGEVTGIIILSLPIWLLLAYQKKPLILAYLIVTIFSSSLVNLIVKLSFQRMRPQLWDVFYLPHSFSFPSGHAMGSMTLVMALLLITRGTIWHNICLIWGSLYLLLIAWTRLYLGVHYPTDILGGWLLAIVWTKTVYWLCLERVA